MSVRWRLIVELDGRRSTRILEVRRVPITIGTRRTSMIGVDRLPASSTMTPPSTA